ncbi:hypothetical protein SteCoe_1211 [Stentor coeruleus]|uniref:Uncharacterized protein n=1 Tax=Stentor coeruleus TaxID=5963 RepID=A0A1R2D2E4_9CILI|nr:hypothetical protein SteCoe_1211 [Stentor coeruleus]
MDLSELSNFNKNSRLENFNAKETVRFQNDTRSHTVLDFHKTLNFSKKNMKTFNNCIRDTETRSTTTIANSPLLEPTRRFDSDSAVLINYLKQTIHELNKEARNYAAIELKVHTKKDMVHCKSKDSYYLPETLESEGRLSHTSKNNDIFAALENLKKCMNDLQNKFASSEIISRQYEKDNKEIKEIAKDIEEKIEKKKIFGENKHPNWCVSRCQII